ncbi:hypothetical protein CJ030_MR5G011878 [Morella rubra]|uniref:Uncharacterized protein n=1 Tax=Morella rubra TaxID=262757 RepID=A0A6A1VLT3_9ROSI|nr:hypothetical protein CJ030_MR5G011878 [Morella rubra]
MDARASELFHTRFQKRHVIVERDVALSKLHHSHDIPSVFTSRYWEPFLQKLSNLIPLELFVRDFFSNFFDIDEASLSFSIFVRGQHLRVSPDIIAQVFIVTRVTEPIYQYEESRIEPPSFKARTLRLFQRPYPNMGGTLYPVSHLSSISLSRIFYATGAKTLFQNRAHLWCLQASSTARADPSSQPPSSVPFSSVPPSFFPLSSYPSTSVPPPSADPSSSSFIPSRSLLPSSLDPSFTTSFSLILDRGPLTIVETLRLLLIPPVPPADDHTPEHSVPDVSTPTAFSPYGNDVSVNTVADPTPLAPDDPDSMIP